MKKLHKITRSKNLHYLVYGILYCILNLSLNAIVFYLFEATALLASLNPGLVVHPFSAFYNFGIDSVIIAMAVLSVIMIFKLKNKILFFIITFISITFGHIALSFITSVELKDWKLIIGAIVYLTTVAYCLLLLRSRIMLITKNGSKFIKVLLGLLLLWILIVAETQTFDFKLYLAFAWYLNKFDYLFSKLNMDYTYFEIVLANLTVSIIGIVLVKKEKSLKNIWTRVKRQV